MQNVITLVLSASFGVMSWVNVLESRPVSEQKNEKRGAATMFDVIGDACEKIRQTKSVADGHLYRIACTYAFADNELVKMSTKVYYSDYRRKPDYNESIFSTETSPDRVVEVIYNKSNKNRLALRHKNPRSNKKLLCQEVFLVDSCNE
jgi:hypothetical protein